MISSNITLCHVPTHKILIIASIIRLTSKLKFSSNQSSTRTNCGHEHLCHWPLSTEVVYKSLKMVWTWLWGHYRSESSKIHIMWNSCSHFLNWLWEHEFLSLLTESDVIVKFELFFFFRFYILLMDTNDLFKPSFS